MSNIVGQLVWFIDSKTRFYEQMSGVHANCCLWWIALTQFVKCMYSSKVTSTSDQSLLRCRNWFITCVAAEMMTPNNILVTGGCGFIGSAFINYIAPRFPHATIVNYDKLILRSNANNVDESIRQSAQYILVTGDICNWRLVKQTLDKYNVSIMFWFELLNFLNRSTR